MVEPNLDFRPNRTIGLEPNFNILFWPVKKNTSKKNYKYQKKILQVKKKITSQKFFFYKSQKKFGSR